ncbi:hypothetical protein BC829DRAFT_419336 [Chytridium lagenaria]|nr:hypothetical protein BC829DRAFT_419336 [Chytridium lagenaria]
MGGGGWGGGVGEWGGSGERGGSGGGGGSRGMEGLENGMSEGLGMEGGEDVFTEDATTWEESVRDTSAWMKMGDVMTREDMDTSVRTKSGDVMTREDMDTSARMNIGDVMTREDMDTSVRTKSGMEDGVTRNRRDTRKERRDEGMRIPKGDADTRKNRGDALTRKKKRGITFTQKNMGMMKNEDAQKKSGVMMEDSDDEWVEEEESLKEELEELKLDLNIFNGRGIGVR